MRVLIVEDDAEWREALYEMYKVALGDGEHEIRAVSNGIEVTRQLKELQYDVLSLDINLRMSAIVQTDGNFRGASGMDVLRFAHERKRVQGVVVISGCTWDHELDDAVPESKDVMAVRATMPAILRRKFGDQGRFFTKPEPGTKGASIDGAIAAWRGTITRNFLEELAAGRLLPVPYSLTIIGDAPLQRTVVVHSKKTGKNEEIRDPYMAEFVYSLASHWKDGAKGIDHKTAADVLIGKEAALDSFKQLQEERGSEGEKRVRQLWQQRVSHYVAEFRKKIRDLGIDPDGLVTKPKRVSGFRLAPSIAVSDVHGVRGWTPVGQGARKDIDDPITEKQGRELNAADEAIAHEMQGLKDQFLQGADFDQEEQFSNMPQDDQHNVLDIFARHLRKGHV